jgi:excisionase family DNA binding protein
MTEGAVFALSFPPELLEVFSQRVAKLVADQLASSSEASSPWLNVESAALYLDTTDDGIRAMVKRGQLPVYRSPTGRLLFRREELDEWARGEAA